MKGCRCQADSLIQVFAQFSGDPKDPIEGRDQLKSVGFLESLHSRP